MKGLAPSLPSRGPIASFLVGFQRRNGRGQCHRKSGLDRAEESKRADGRVKGEQEWG